VAYTNTPQISTYKTQRINLVGNPQYRNGTSISKDQRFVNAFPEGIKSIDSENAEYYVKERAGLQYQSGSAVAEGRGLFNFNGSVWTAVGSTLYRNGTSVATLGNSTGKVGFTLFNGTYDAMCVFDGIKGWVVKTDNSVTQITDVDFPTPHVPTPVFIDGYLLCVKAGTADIYNCTLEDPFTWDSSNFITAEMYPDPIVALTKNKNYVCAIGEKTTEFFYDAGIATGSPFARNDSFVQQIGAPAIGAIAGTTSEIVFVGSTGQSGRSVWVMSGVKVTEVGIEPIRQVLDAEGTNISTAKAFTVRTKGHEFFVVNLTARTLVYDITLKLWHEWAAADGVSVFPCNYAADNTSGSSYLLHSTNGNLFKLVDSLATDEYTSGVLTSITVSMTTIRVDFGNNNNKYLSRFSLIGDSPNGSTPTTCTIQWSDDDYDTWSTGTTMSMTDKLMTITQLGGFRRRAFRITYSQPYPLRLTGFEIDINLGTR
jgi:hypothetical protein